VIAESYEFLFARMVLRGEPSFKRDVRQPACLFTEVEIALPPVTIPSNSVSGIFLWLVGLVIWTLIHFTQLSVCVTQVCGRGRERGVSAHV
jgi:hypothetical protein